MRTNKIKQMITAIASASLLATSVVPSTAYAGGGGLSGGSTEITQILNNIELMQVVSSGLAQVNTLTQTMQMHQEQLKNLIAAPTSAWNETVGHINKIANVVQSANDIAYQFQRVEALMDSRFPGFSKSGQGGLKGAMGLVTDIQANMAHFKNIARAAGMRQEAIMDESTRIKSLMSLGQSAQGQLQATQAAIQIAGMQTQTMQQMSMTMADQLIAFQRAQMQTEQEKADGIELQKALITPHKPRDVKFKF